MNINGYTKLMIIWDTGGYTDKIKTITCLDDLDIVIAVIESGCGNILRISKI